MIDHGIDIARGDQERQAGRSQAAKAFDASPVRLWDQTDAVPPAFQQAGNQRGAERWVIHVGITGEEDKVELPPSALERLFPVYRKKSVHVP